MQDILQHVQPLKVENLSKSFRQGSEQVTALDKVGFQFEDGDFVALMGSSGSGKSTLLHLIAGLTRPDAGSVWVEGQDLSTLKDRDLTDFRRRRIGLVFQALNLIPALTAEENVRLPLQAGGAPAEAYEAVDELVTRLGLASRRTHRPDSLSGGEQQRVAIARALVYNPALILADEPTGNLDSANTNNICQLLRRFNEEDRRTILLVTHEPNVAMWADRVIVLKDGQLLSTINTADFSSSQALAAHYQELIEASPQSASSA